MATPMLIEDIRRHHVTFPPLPETVRLLEEFEQRAARKLPASMVEFFRAFGSASLFGGSFNLFSLPELTRASEAVCEEDSEDYAPKDWWAFGDYFGDQGGEYLGLVLDGRNGHEARVIDMYCDDFPECLVIAEGYEEFLGNLLASDGTAFWRKPGLPKIEKLTYEQPPGYWRRLHETWYSDLGPEIGPTKCTTPDCTCLAIRSSTKCRAHHYQMIFRMPSPFPPSSEA